MVEETAVEEDDNRPEGHYWIFRFRVREVTEWTGEV